MWPALYRNGIRQIDGIHHKVDDKRNNNHDSGETWTITHNEMDVLTGDERDTYLLETERFQAVFRPKIPVSVTLATHKLIHANPGRFSWGHTKEPVAADLEIVSLTDTKRHFPDWGTITIVFKAHWECAYLLNPDEPDEP
jgi:hypothetical protein